MEQSITRLESRVDNLEVDVKNLCDKVDNHEYRLSEVEKANLIMANDLSHIRDKLTEISQDIKNNNEHLKQDIKDLRTKREEDHYVKPLSKHEARNEQFYKWIVGGVIGALIGALMTALLSGGFYN